MGAKGGHNSASPNKVKPSLENMEMMIAWRRTFELFPIGQMKELIPMMFNHDKEQDLI